MYAYWKPTDQVCNKNVFSKFAKYATMHRIQKKSLLYPETHMWQVWQVITMKKKIGLSPKRAKVRFIYSSKKIPFGALLIFSKLDGKNNFSLMQSII